MRIHILNNSSMMPTRDRPSTQSQQNQQHQAPFNINGVSTSLSLLEQVIVEWIGNLQLHVQLLTQMLEVFIQDQQK